MLESYKNGEQNIELHKNTRLPQVLFQRVFSTKNVVQNIIGSDKKYDKATKIATILDTAMSRIENGQSIINNDAGTQILEMINMYNELNNQEKKNLVLSYGEDFGEDFVRVRKQFHELRLKDAANDREYFETTTKKLDPTFNMNLLAA